MAKQQRSLVSVTPQNHMGLEACILGWIHAKAHRSESHKTEKAYTDTITHFRALLKLHRLDLDGEPALIAPLAQGWAGTSTSERNEVTPNTFNQRLAILSSFYKYAIKNDVLSYNPIERVERRVVRKKHAARPLVAEQIKAGLGGIDRDTLEGKRDYALLSLALATGRRESELAALRYGHIQKHGTTCTITWERCKGNKQMTDLIQERVTAALYEYLYAQYGSHIGTLGAESPVWVSYSPHNNGEAIGPRTVSRICADHFGTGKVHTLRHTWAVTMHKKGATLAEIGRGLGHSNLKTTSDYLEEQLGYENPYAHQLEEEFGI